MDELGHLGWVAHRSFELDGLLFGIRTDSKDFARWLEDALPATLVLDEEADPNYSVALSREGKIGKRFFILYRDSTVLTRTFDAGELVGALLADLDSLTYGHRRDAVYVKATFLALAGIDAIFPEELFATFDEMRRQIRKLGLRLPASRFLAVDLKTGEVIPSPRSLQLDAAALEELARLVPSEPTVWPRAILDRRTTVELLCTMGSPGAEPVQPVSRGFALYVLASLAANLHEVGGAGLEALRQLVEQAACWEVSSQRPQLMAESALGLALSIDAERTKATVGGTN
jgi:hypothetical protein